MRLRTRCRDWLLFGLMAGAPVLSTAQETPPAGTSSLDALVQQAAATIQRRYTRALGRVVDRQRGRIFVAIEGEPPELGALLAVLRPIPGAKQGESRPIAQLQVSQVSPAMVECREISRAGRERTEKADIVRAHGEPVRVLLAPCATLVDLPAVIPEVVGEKLRSLLRSSPDLQLAGDPARERAAGVAYASHSIAAFLREQEDLDEVLFPVLLRTPEKLVLQIECHSFARERAVDIAVASVDLDPMLRSWFDAEAPRQDAPPGYRLLSRQVFPWSVNALAGAMRGALVAVSRDSVRLLAFRHPGLHPAEAIALGARDATRRGQSVLVLGAETLRAAGVTIPAAHDLWLLSGERWPRALGIDAAGHLTLIGSAGTGLELRPALEALWKAARGPEELAARWWPAPGRGERPAFLPVFADLDGDHALDLVWNDRRGTLQVQRSSAQLEAFRAFGDVKTVQPSTGDDSRAIFWLTDPVFSGSRDRLLAAHLDQRSLRLVWSSEPFAGMLTALASQDLNGDGLFDLVAAEQHREGVRLHVYLATPGERTEALGSPQQSEPR